MATPQKQEVSQLVEFFKALGERQELCESLEGEVKTFEELLARQRQEVQDLRTEREALQAIIEALTIQLDDLTSAIPLKAQALELRLSDLHRAIADAQEQLRRLQAYQQSVKEQISDAERVLRGLKDDIMGLSNHARARTFSPAPSLSGPAIISPAPDYNPLEPSDEEASA